MGPGPRLSFFFSKNMFTFGVSFDSMPYRYTFGIYIPFCLIQIGLGPSYLDDMSTEEEIEVRRS